jgi:hypothetical protein
MISTVTDDFTTMQQGFESQADNSSSLLKPAIQYLLPLYQAGANPAANSPNCDIVLSRCKSYCKLPLKEIIDYKTIERSSILLFGKADHKSIITNSLLCLLLT